MVTQCANSISIGIMKKLEPFLAIVEHTTEILQDMMVESRKVADRLYRTSKEARDELQKAAKVMKDGVSSAMESACEEIMKAAEGLGEVVGKSRGEGL